MFRQEEGQARGGLEGRQEGDRDVCAVVVERVEMTVFLCRNVFKLIVIGDMSVGKTCILTRFTEQLFDENYSATIGVDFVCQMKGVLENDCDDTFLFFVAEKARL